MINPRRILTTSHTSTTPTEACVLCGLAFAALSLVMRLAQTSMKKENRVFVIVRNSQQPLCILRSFPPYSSAGA